MSYGVNAPWGLRPMMKQGASTFDMAETYPIKSGQATNIFTGDAVCLSTEGYIVPYIANATLSNTNFPVGVFVGCEYIVPAATNPTNLYQMNPMWTSGTVTANGADAKGYVITDTSVFFNVQANNPSPLVGSGTTGSIIGGVANIAVGAGNSATGQSGMMLNYTSIVSTMGNFNPALATYGANMYPLKIRGVVQVPGNTLSTATTVGIPYVNLIVSLNNTVYQTGQISA